MRGEPREGDDLPAELSTREAISRIRHEVLGGHRPAMTINITDTYAEEWLLEIEAIAVSAERI